MFYICVPRGMAFDRSAQIYVSQSFPNSRIQVLTERGDHLQWLGDKELNCPFDVSIDSNNTVYVCDTNNHQICVFDCNGKLLCSFGAEGRQPGQFSFPSGLAVDKNAMIYVSDTYNDRVQIF